MAQAIIDRQNGEENDLVKQLRRWTPSSWYRSADLMQLCFKDDISDRGKANLKDLAVRMHWPKIQDLPNPKKPKSSNTVKMMCSSRQSFGIVSMDTLHSGPNWKTYSEPMFLPSRNPKLVRPFSNKNTPRNRGSRRASSKITSQIPQRFPFVILSRA